MLDILYKIIRILKSCNFLVELLKLEFYLWERFPYEFRSHQLTLSPLSRISSALAPRTVQCTAIFSLRLIPKDLTVYLAFEKTGVWPVKDSKTLAARVKRSPLSPTQILRHNLRICNSLIGFFALLVCVIITLNPQCFHEFFHQLFAFLCSKIFQLNSWDF